jgi:hypothetical protein
MTKRGREELGNLILLAADPIRVVPGGMKSFVEKLISEYGRTIDELLQDSIFEWFPIVESCYMGSYILYSSFTRDDEDEDKFMPLLHMAILLVTSPPAAVLDGPMLDTCTFHTDLHKAIKALVAVISLNTKAHIHLIQTLGLIALYEFGIGSFEQAHITLTSAFAMTNMVGIDPSDMEAQLTWKVCLMTLDR